MSTLDLQNIQGDILVGIPKKTQTYFFFQIEGDPSLFRKALVDVVPLIKSSSQVQKDRDALKEHKRKGDKSLIPMAGAQIAFSNAGLVKMGITGVASPSKPATDPFITGQFKDAFTLGDAGTGTQDDFVPAWDPAFGNANIDGLIFVGGDCHDSVNKELHKIKLILGPSVKKVIEIVGDTRPGPDSGHEHFGFLDGISNPTLKEFNPNPLPGPDPIDATVVLTGQNTSSSPPPVFVNGSFLAFRYLFQLVPEFDQFLKENPINGDSELLGARIVGRWKSGAPIDLTPQKDDPALGKDSQKNNNFFYAGELTKGDQSRCPYSAHTRKTNPRADFTEHGLTDALEQHRIMRRGIQFGPEVTPEESQNHRTLHGRGLLFACYQSDITAGFQFVQQSWANNAGFLFSAVDNNLKPLKPGLDGIIGQDADQARGVVGTNPADPDGNLTIPRFVVPQGGEYFFSPSINALRDIIALGVNIG
ncbi:dye-decolorizing heme-containing peroxidase [Stygiomarasmius scandens]|uniref:Dye-decolorizing heme-containing peroxidase n=1 Tax=Marasmiellus scandens TaxID=2682957 RepID=A0ABR1IW34_9AGAR